jgi:hypothetical protein
MKILLITTMFGRYELTDFVFNYYNNLKNKLKNKLELSLLSCGSEGSVSKNIAIKNNFDYIEYENTPLSKKHNFLLSYAKNYDVDGVVLIGSDDIISESTFDIYIDAIKNNIDFVGFTDLYMYDGCLHYWPGYTNERIGETIGAGRFFSRKVLDENNWDFWGNILKDSGLDKIAYEKIKKNNLVEKQISCKNSDHFIIDIKSDTNITKLNRFKNLRSISKEKFNSFVDFKSIDNIISSRLECDLSILISTYDNIEYLKDCFNSIIKSIGNNNVEVLIGIDSCLKTKEYIMKNYFPDNFRFYFFEENVGPYKVFNTLSEISNSDKIMFFGSDDIMGETMVSDMIDGLSHTDCVRSSYINFKNGDNINNLKNKKESEGGVFAIKKDIFNKLNGFEPWMCEADTEFMVRFFKSRFKLKVSNKIDFYRRIHSNGLTSRPDTGMNSKLRNEYRKIYQNKKDFGPLPKKVTESYIVLKKGLFVKKENVTETKQKSVNPLGGLFNRPKIEEPKVINHEKVNEVTQNRQTQKPERPQKNYENKNSNSDMAKNAIISKKPFKPNGGTPLMKIGKDFLRI